MDRTRDTTQQFLSLLETNQLAYRCSLCDKPAISSGHAVIEVELEVSNNRTNTHFGIECHNDNGNN